MFGQRTESGAPKSADEWFTPWRFAGAFGFLILLMFPDVIFGGRTFIFRDFGQFGYPLAYYYRECFWRGEMPLWNPLNYCGMPFLAQWNTMVLYPGSLFYLLLPLHWSLAVFNLLHLLLCGVTMYALAWNWTQNRIAATVAGLAFGFNGFTLNCLMWPNYIASLAWMPLVILTVERAWRGGGRRLFAWAALTAAMQMLSGTPEIILFTWVLLAVLWIQDLVQQHEARLQIAVRFLAVVLVVTGLASAQLFPFLDLLKHSQRESGALQEEWSMPVTGWANFLVPLFRTTRSAPGVHFQEDQQITSSYYSGIGMFVLALIGTLLVRERRVRLLGVITGICLVMAIGPKGKFYSIMLNVFPPLGFMRFPIKFVMLPMFLIPLLAAFAVKAYFKASAEDKKTFWRAGLISGVFCLVAIALLLGFDFRHPAQGEVWQTTATNGITRAALLVAILGFWFVAGRSLNAARISAFVLGLLVLSWLDVLTHAPSQNPTVERGVFLPSYSPLTEMKPRPALGESRAMLSLEAILAHRTKMLTNAASAYLLNRLGLYNNLNLLDGVPKIDGFFALELRQERNLRFTLYPGTNAYRVPLANFLSVSQVNSETNIFVWTARSNYLPMATTGQKPIFLDSPNTLAALGNPDFDPSHMVYFLPEDQARVSVTNQTSSQVISSNWTAHRVELDVQAPERSLVVIGQTFHHNWKASVDKKPTRLFLANYAFQALEVPSGLHRVTLVYRDGAFQVGVIVSLATLIFVAVLALLSRKQIS